VTRAFTLQQNLDNTTTIEIVGSANLNGYVPQWISDAFAVPSLANPPLNLLTFFITVRPLEDYDDADSKELGRFIFHTLSPLLGSPSALRNAITKMLARTAALRSVCDKYSWFEELFYRVIKNTVQKAHTVFGSLASYTLDDAKKTGEGFAIILHHSESASDAVDKWISFFPALEEVAIEYSFFRPMMIAIATELLTYTTFGEKLKTKMQILILADEDDDKSNILSNKSYSFSFNFSVDSGEMNRMTLVHKKLEMKRGGEFVENNSAENNATKQGEVVVKRSNRFVGQLMCCMCARNNRVADDLG
jgi:hypothetical protein